MLSDIDIFIKLVTYGSFSITSDKLGIQQPTISKRIRKLEEELGIVLVNRKYKTLTLTSGGKTLYQKFSHLSEYADIAIEQIKNTYGKESEEKNKNTLNVIFGPAFSQDFVLYRLKEFSTMNPDVVLNMMFVFGKIPSEMIAKADVILTAQEIKDVNFDYRMTRTESLQLFASKAYNEKNGVPKRIEELSQHRIMGGLDSNWDPIDTTTIVNQYTNEETVLSTNNPKLRSNNIVMTKSIGMSSDDHLFWGLSNSYKEEIKNCLIVPVLSEWVMYKMTFTLISRKAKTAHHQNLINFLRNCIS